MVPIAFLFLAIIVIWLFSMIDKKLGMYALKQVQGWSTASKSTSKPSLFVRLRTDVPAVVSTSPKPATQNHTPLWPALQSVPFDLTGSFKIIASQPNSPEPLQKNSTCSVQDSEWKVAEGAVASSTTITDQRGAVMTAWAEPGFSGAGAKRWACQVGTHQAYCAKHGYKCHYVHDTGAWEAERKKRDLPRFWLKIQAMRELLPKHPWLLYLDVDAMVTDVENATSVEQLFSEAPAATSLFVPDSMTLENWNTDTILLKNDAVGQKFLDRVWQLGDVCPDCLGEQCAVNLGLFDAIMAHQVTLVDSGLASKQIEVDDYRGGSCCEPRTHCEYPDGRMGSRNPSVKSYYFSQGCVWNWQRRLVQAGRSSPPWIAWNATLRKQMKIEHPVKEYRAKHFPICQKLLDVDASISSLSHRTTASITGVVLTTMLSVSSWS